MNERREMLMRMIESGQMPLTDNNIGYFAELVDAIIEATPDEPQSTIAELLNRKGFTDAKELVEEYNADEREKFIKSCYPDEPPSTPETFIASQNDTSIIGNIERTCKESLTVQPLAQEVLDEHKSLVETVSAKDYPVIEPTKWSNKYIGLTEEESEKFESWYDKYKPTPIAQEVEFSIEYLSKWHADCEDADLSRGDAIDAILRALDAKVPDAVIEDLRIAQSNGQRLAPDTSKWLDDQNRGE